MLNEGKVHPNLIKIGWVSPGYCEFLPAVQAALDEMSNRIGVYAGVHINSVQGKPLEESYGMEYWYLLAPVAMAGGIVIGTWGGTSKTGSGSNYGIYITSKDSVEEFVSRLLSLEPYSPFQLRAVR